MRIIGGAFGGRVIHAPPGLDTRPTSEKVRAAIFNILPDMVGRVVLDMFAGSGALGIEALSRGAEYVTFVEKSKGVRDVLMANLAALHVDMDTIRVLGGDAVKLAASHTPSVPFDTVFIDPPYNSDLAIRAAHALDLTDSDAIVVIEHDGRHLPPETLGSLLRTDQRRYGDTFVSFYRVRT